MSPQDRRTAAALAYAEAAWKLDQADRAWSVGAVADAGGRLWQRLQAAEVEHEAARDVWFALAAEAATGPTSDERRDAILARIAETLPKPGGPQ